MDAEAARERLLSVQGERFRVRLRPRHGCLFEYDADWLTGRYDGYGFGISGPFEQSDDQHKARIRDFLAEIGSRDGVTWPRTEASADGTVPKEAPVPRRHGASRSAARPAADGCGWTTS